MALGKLLAASALEVAPGQIADFEGGRINNLTQVEQGLAHAAAKGKLESGLPVTLRLDGNRTSALREAALQAGFGTKAELAAASMTLAARLGVAMDGRSSSCLLVISAHATSSARRQVVAWTFPREQMLRRSGTNVDLEDAFSLNSRLRKAALLTGANNRTGFLTARVLDYQTTSVDRSVADFWIFKFLDAKLQIDSAEGTNKLAAILRKANDKLDDLPAQDQLHAAVAAVRTHARTRWSISDFAHELLPPGPARDEVLRVAGSGEETTAVFDLDVAQFDTLVQYRVYYLSSGVRVSAPFREIGDSVKIDESGQDRTLTATGTIQSEKMRTRA